MSSDLPDRLMDIGTGDAEERRSETSDQEEEAYERFLFVYIGTHKLAIPVTDIQAITDPPLEVTRVPRTPNPIVGMTDIRGEITIIINPHYHFPDSGGPSRDPGLLVFDRPDQPAAIGVDEVIGVESVPDGDVLDRSQFTETQQEGTPLEHPLIVGVVRQERRSRQSVREAIAAESASNAKRLATETEQDRRDVIAEIASKAKSDDEFEVEVQEFTLDEEEPEPVSDETEDEDVEIEATPLLGVDRLLNASGRLSDGSF